MEVKYNQTLTNDLTNKVRSNLVTTNDSTTNLVDSFNLTSNYFERDETDISNLTYDNGLDRDSFIYIYTGLIITSIILTIAR